jgi:hypothetical protein
MGLRWISVCHERGLRADLIFCIYLTFPLFLPCLVHKGRFCYLWQCTSWGSGLLLQWFHELPCGLLPSFFSCVPAATAHNHLPLASQAAGACAPGQWKMVSW